MARQVDRLNARTVKTLGVGFHADGGGLYLRVEPSGGRRWAFLFRYRGKRCEMGFGALADISLAVARDLAAQARKLVQEGKNPIDARRAQKAAVAAIPFGELARQVVKDLTPGWKNPKVPKQWLTTLTVDAADLCPLMVDHVTTEHVLGVLKPIWTAKPVTASRLRGRIERVLDVAKVSGMREGENPARWKGHMALLLPRRRRKVRNHPALHFDRVKEFFTDLRQSESLSSQALEFTILTVARTIETRMCTGLQIDVREAVWTVPGELMKSGREHRVPLSPRALEIAKARIEVCGAGFLFPGQFQRRRRSNSDGPRPISDAAMSKQLKLLGYTDITVHGFRSTFRDWGGDRTAFPRELIEAAMAHILGDEAEQAYRRSDALERRRQLMDAWAAHCEPANSGQVITLSA